MQPYRRCRWAVFLTLLTLGCNRGGHSDRLPTFSIQGVVTVDGDSIGSARLQLTPEPDSNLPPVAGKVDDAGRFTLTTYVANDGAPAGNYLAKLAPDFTNSEEFPGTLPLEVEISPADLHPTWDFEGTGKPAESLLSPPPGRKPNRE